MNREMMKAAVLTGPETVVVKDVPVPVVGPGEMEIRVSACGLSLIHI